MAKPKLALIPAAQGDKFYSVLPSDGVGDFTFARGSKATRINAQGLIEEVVSGKSRLNYDLLNGKVVNCPHYLLEPARTNYLTNSDNGSTYTVFSATKTLDEQISPDGTLNSFTLTGNGDYNQILGETPFVTLPSGGDYTFSVFAKKGTHSKVQLFLNGFTSSSNNEAYFDLENNITPSSNGKIENYGNGWYRLSFVSTVDATDLYGRIGFRVSYTTSDFFFPSASDSIGKSLYFYGFQLEQGSYSTSYIPTNGTAITRAAESATGSGDAATFNDSEGVLMAETSALAKDSAFELISISGTDSYISFGFSNNTTSLYIDSKINNIQLFPIPNTLINQTENNKIAVKYKSGNTKLYVNGFNIISTTVSYAVGSSSLNNLKFKYKNDAFPFYGKTREIQYFDSVLTDAQLETLTSWTSLQEMITSQLYTNY